MLFAGFGVAIYHSNFYVDGVDNFFQTSMKTIFKSFGKWPRILGAGLFMAALSALVSPTLTAPARAEGTFISAPGRVDFVHDTRRGKIYISSGNQLLIYNVATGTVTPYNELNARAGQLDISPDGQTLAVAIRPSVSTSSVQPAIALINLATFQCKTVPPALNNFSGASSVAFDNAGSLFIGFNDGYGYSSPLRYFLNSNTVQKFAYPSLTNPLFVASPDHQTVGFATLGLTPGSKGIFDGASGRFVSPSNDYDSGFNYELGVSSDGNQLATPQYSSFKIYDASGNRIANFGGFGAGTFAVNTGMGVAYNPNLPRFYAPWSDTNQVRIYDSGSFTQIGSYDFETTFNWQGNGTFTKGHTRVSDDGSLLMVSVDNGVRFVRLADSPATRPLQLLGDSFAIDEDTSQTFSLKTTGGSPTSGPTITLTTVPQNGTLTQTPGTAQWTYQPRRDFNGTDRVRLTATQTGAAPSSAWVYFAIAPVNDAPILTGDATPVRARKNGWGDINTNNYRVSDPDANDVGYRVPFYSYRVSRAPQNGTADNGFGGGFVYRPNRDFVGTDSFEVVANDADSFVRPPVIGLDSNPVTVNVVVFDNAAPIARDDSYYNVSMYSTFRAPAPGVLINDSDADSDAITASTTGYISWGNASISPNGALTWSPWTSQTNYQNKITISYAANDVYGSGNTATITLYSGPPTIAANQSRSTPRDVALPLTLSATGTGQISYAIVAGPQHGTLSGGDNGTGANLVYLPTPGFSGADEFTFRATSASGATGTAKVSITVISSNAAPLAPDQTISGFQDETIQFALKASDPDGDALTYSITRAPAHGELSGFAPGLFYRPFDGYAGDDEFAYKVNDGALDSREATVKVSVARVSHAPVALADEFAASEDTLLEVVAPGVLANDSDVDGDALTVRVVTQPTNGTLQMKPDGSFSYQPDANWNGDDSFVYVASDGVLESAPVAVTLKVAAVDDAPVARPDTLNGAREDEPSFIADATLLDNDSDPDGALQNPQLDVVQAPAHGVLTRTNGGFNYAPTPDFNGADSFTYRIKNGDLWSNAALVSFVVAPVNDAPVTLSTNATGNEDEPLTIALSGADVDGDALTYQIVRAPARGTLTLDGANAIYTPAPDFNGADSFTFRAFDGALWSESAIVSLQIAPVNDAPVASGQAVSTASNTAKTIALSGSDLDGDALTFAVLSQPANGTLRASGANWIYTPNSGYSGTDSFTFRAFDGALWSNPATVSITIAAALPVATASTVSLLEDRVVTVQLAGTASGGASINVWSVLSGASNGTVSGSDNAVNYQPNADYFGSDSFTFRVRDTRGNWSEPATISLNVTPVNDAPSFNLVSTVRASKSAPLQTVANVASSISAGPQNEKGQTFAFICSNSNSALFSIQPTLAPDGTLTFQPRKGQRGTAHVQVTLRDNGGTSNDGQDQSQPKTFAIQVN